MRARGIVWAGILVPVFLVPVLLVPVLRPPALAADPSGTPASRAALDDCQRTEAMPSPARAPLLERSLAAADTAIAADEADALAHFAAFCALGGLLQANGVGLAAPWQLHRLRREVDRTLALAPDFADALAGKGALLLNLPRLLGGDAVEGERLLRRALAADPDYLTPRLALVDALRARGAVLEAQDEARRALAIAGRKRSAADVAAATTRLRELDASAGTP